MQRTRIFTAGPAFSARVGSRAAAEALVAALLVGLCAAAAWVILAFPKPAVYDQARLLAARFEAPYHPSPAYGFTAQLAVIAIRALAPAGGPALHEWVRLVAMLAYAGAAAALAARLLASRALVAAFLVFLFASLYPLLWLSTELIAGCLLCVALLSSSAGWPRAATGALLALLALCKPELMLVSAALLVVWIPRCAGSRERLALAGTFAGALALLLLPGVLLLGPGYLVRYGDGERGFASFAQHFAALVAPLQVADGAPNPWLEPRPYLERVFPGARSLADVLTAPGLPYLDFVALSVAKGVRKAGFVASWAALAAPLLVVARRRAGLRLDDAERALLATFVGVLPFVLLAYPHIRYFARYYPLFLLLLLRSLERLAEVAPTPQRAGALAPAGLCLAAALAVLASRASATLSAVAHLEPFW